MSDTNRIEYNRRVVEEFRAKGGNVQGWAPLILLTTKGAKSGQTRVYPLMSVPDGGHYLAVASKGGAPKNPLWYYNLLAHPDVTVEVGNEKFAATARLLTGNERDKHLRRRLQCFLPMVSIKRKRPAKSLFFCSNGVQTRRVESVSAHWYTRCGARRRIAAGFFVISVYVSAREVRRHLSEYLNLVKPYLRSYSYYKICILIDKTGT